MKLYYRKDACSLACRIIINELGLDCEYEYVSLRNKKTESGHDFLTINSKGTIPALELENGEILTENAVILQYLADTANASKLLPPPGYFDRYRVLEWVNYISTELHKNFCPMFNQSVPQAIREEVHIPLIKHKLAFVDKHLQKHTWIAGEHFTLPDAYLFVILIWWAKYFHFDLAEWPNLNRFFNLMNQHESVKASLQQERND